MTAVRVETAGEHELRTTTVAALWLRSDTECTLLPAQQLLCIDNKSGSFKLLELSQREFKVTSFQVRHTSKITLVTCPVMIALKRRRQKKMTA